MRDGIVFLLVLILASVGYIATDIYLPSMPHITHYFGTTSTLVQLTFSVYMLSFAITPLFIGPLSDNIGRKRPILAGIYISLFSTLLCAISDSVYLLIFSRFLQGIGMGIIVSTGRAILPDHFQGKRLAKSFSYMSMCMALVLAVAPPIGGIIQDNTSWHMVFIAMFFYLLAVLIFVQVVLKENPLPNLGAKNLNKGVKHYFVSYKMLLSNTSFMLYTLCTVLTVMGVIIYLTASPFLFQFLIGLSATEYGLTALVVCGTIFISGFINARLINVFKARTLLFLTNFLILLSGVLFITFNQLSLINVYTILIPAIVYFLSMPISFSNAGSLSLGSIQGNFGAATALVASLQFIGGVISSVFISLLGENSLLPLGIGYILIGIGYFIILRICDVKS